MNMHRNLWLAGVLVPPAQPPEKKRQLCLSILTLLCSPLLQNSGLDPCNSLWSVDISQCDISEFVEGLHTQVVLLENFILEPRYHPIGKSRLSCLREIACGMAQEDETQQGEGGHLEENQGPPAKFLVNSTRDLS